MNAAPPTPSTAHLLLRANADLLPDRRATDHQRRAGCHKPPLKYIFTHRAC